MYYVNARWLGGMLTNFKTIKKRISRLFQLDKMAEDGTMELLPKKEVIKLNLEKERLEKFLGGIKNMQNLPSAMFVVDPRKEKNAIAEAHKLGIPVIAIVDTNCDPEEADYPIPGNDDAIRAVKLIVSTIGNAILEGKQGEQMEETQKRKRLLLDVLDEYNKKFFTKGRIKMAFTAQDVKTLREMTGCGMMDCKKALTETDGDQEKGY